MMMIFFSIRSHQVQNEEEENGIRNGEMMESSTENDFKNYLRFHERLPSRISFSPQTKSSEGNKKKRR